MALQQLNPHGYGRNYWDVWEWPTMLFNQNFGMGLSDLDDLNRGLKRPLGYQIGMIKRDGISWIINDPCKFSVKLDVNHFKPEEIEIIKNGNTISIHGKHDDRMDHHGFITREFTRKYVLPSECEADKVVSSYRADGVLTIEAPKKIIENAGKDEQLIPMTVQN